MSRQFQDYFTAYVYKNKNNDSSNGGLSSRHDQVIIFRSELSIPYIVEIIKQDNLDIDKCVQAVYRKQIEYVHLEPISAHVDVDTIHSEKIEYIDKWCMFGGCYVSSSDSRFKECVHQVKYPISLHDRIE